MIKTTKTKTTQAKTQQKSPIVDNSKLIITLKANDIKPVYQKHLKSLAKSVKVDGFRKGMAPSVLVEQKIGQEKIINKVLDELLPVAYQEAIKQAKQKPLTRPLFQPSKIVTDGDWEVTAHFAQKPVIELGDYKKIVKSAKKEAEVEIKKLADQLKQQTKKKTDNSDQAKKSTTKTDKTKKAEETQKTDQPAISDNQKKDMVLQHIFQALIAKVNPGIPSLLLEDQVHSDFEQFQQSLAKVNLKLEDYLSKQKMDIKQLNTQLATQALGKLQVDFVLQEITLLEKIEANENDVKNKIKEIKNPELEKRIEKDQYYQQYLKAIITRQKTLDFLYNM